MTKIKIPYREIDTSGIVIPSTATTLAATVDALHNFLTRSKRAAAILTGAGISVSSGLSDYRGPNGTYRVNKSHRPTYFPEFMASHEARKRYWARSFLGWPGLINAQPNATHYAIKDLGELGFVSSVITQNVDSFHQRAHPHLHTLELHGYLRAVMCMSCFRQHPREVFQKELARLNPAWSEFLREAVASGELGRPNTGANSNLKGIKVNPDGDVDLPQAPYSTFRYPPCPHCLTNPPPGANGRAETVVVDPDGAWSTDSSAGVLKPAVVMFGENIAASVKEEAERIVDAADRLLVLGTSLATYSAWRLVKRAKEGGKPVAVVTLGGVRGEGQLFDDVHRSQSGEYGVRVEIATDMVMPALVDAVRSGGSTTHMMHQPSSTVKKPPVVHEVLS